jgi:hypothetical protein
MQNPTHHAALAQLRQSDPALYQLRIHGDLDDNWADYMNAILIDHTSDADTMLPTTLICAVTDQAQLVGMLHMLQIWGVELIKLECMSVAKSAPAGLTNSLTQPWGANQWS